MGSSSAPAFIRSCIDGSRPQPDQPVSLTKHCLGHGRRATTVLGHETLAVTAEAVRVTRV
jgi:hypothetical protein